MSRALDDIAPAFRAACERWPDAPNLKQHYMDLARTWETEGSRSSVAADATSHLALTNFVSPGLRVLFISCSPVHPPELEHSGLGHSHQDFPGPHL